MPPLIELQHVSKNFRRHGQTTNVLDGVSLSIGRSEFVAVVGPSGSGKSTILNLVAGLTRPSSGHVVYDGSVLDTINTRISYLTQHDSLMPWRTVADNVGVPLEIRRIEAGERARRVQQVINEVGLAGFEKHYPAQLSGGMRKRTMLARTLIYSPDTILMDEPFGPLDAQLRLVLQAELLQLWSNSGKTIIFVTHDIIEAITLSDYVVVLSARPSRIKLVEKILIPRPRNVHEVRFTPEFEDHYRRLWESIEVDVMRGASQ